MSAKAILDSFKPLLGKVHTSLYSRNNLALYYVVNSLGYHLNIPGVNRDSVNRIWLIKVNWENVQVIIPQLFFVQLQGGSSYAYRDCHSTKIHGNSIEIYGAPHPTSRAPSFLESCPVTSHSRGLISVASSERTEVPAQILALTLVWNVSSDRKLQQQAPFFTHFPFMKYQL